MDDFVVTKSITTDEFDSDSNHIAIGVWKGREVAIKRGPRLNREMAILQMIGKHPHVVEFIMEIVDDQYMSNSISGITGFMMTAGGNGQTLADLCGYYGCPALSVKTCIDLMKQMAMGLSHLHNLRIIHHDLKDKNVLVQRIQSSSSFSTNGEKEKRDENETYILRLCDFGSSEVLDEKGCGDYEKRSYGTGYYRAPEQFSKSGPPITLKIDIYPFGMLCNLILFTGRTSTTIASTCPMLVILLTEKCMSDDPEKRPDIDGVLRVLNMPELESSPTRDDLM